MGADAGDGSVTLGWNASDGAESYNIYREQQTDDPDNTCADQGFEFTDCSGFCFNDDECGGALLDLHVHDTDFINYCFGMPSAVFSQGYKGPSGGIDHVATHYIYDQSQNAPLVTAEGTWTMQEGYGFNMSYTANFEKATACYLLDVEETLTLFRSSYEPEIIKLDEGMGYEFEIRSFVNDILSNKTININLLKQAAESVAIIEAEMVSIKSCSVVTLSV